VLRRVRTKVKGLVTSTVAHVMMERASAAEELFLDGVSEFAVSKLLCAIADLKQQRRAEQVTFTDLHARVPGKYAH
jgi:hypothetical protein